MTSYIQLLNKIEAFCLAHKQIQKYGGEFREQMPNFSTKDTKYPMVFVSPSNGAPLYDTNEITLDIYCVDIIQKGRENLNTIVSDCHLILTDLYIYFSQGSDLTIDVLGTPSQTPLNNLDLDYVAGWMMTITFQVEGWCVAAIPMGDIPSGQGCEDATYSNSDNSYSGSVLSGGSLSIPDSQINVNGVDEGDVVSVKTIDVNITDGTNPVTPDAVSLNGNILTVAVPSGGSGIDPDVEAFLTASGITDATITSAIDTMVKDLKDFGIWNKCRAIYPFVGGTATTHKFNLKDPRDADDALRLIFFGGITHSATGADPNGTNGYADTFVRASSIGITDIHLSFYSRENTHTGVGDNTDIGHVTTSSNRCFISAGGASNNNPRSGYGNSLLSATGSADGFFIGTLNLEGATSWNRLYKNGTQLISGTANKLTDVVSSLNLFRYGGLGSNYSNRECSFASIGFGLTGTDAANFNTIVQAFQTALGRNV